MSVAVNLGRDLGMSWNGDHPPTWNWARVPTWNGKWSSVGPYILALSVPVAVVAGHLEWNSDQKLEWNWNCSTPQSVKLQLAIAGAFPACTAVAEGDSPAVERYVAMPAYFRRYSLAIKKKILQFLDN